jgi:hypothetical protein
VLPSCLLFPRTHHPILSIVARTHHHFSPSPLALATKRAVVLTPRSHRRRSLPSPRERIPPHPKNLITNDIYCRAPIREYMNDKAEAISWHLDNFTRGLGRAKPRDPNVPVHPFEKNGLHIHRDDRFPRGRTRFAMENRVISQNVIYLFTFGARSENGKRSAQDQSGRRIGIQRGKNATLRRRRWATRTKHQPPFW